MKLDPDKYEGHKVPSVAFEIKDSKALNRLHQAYQVFAQSAAPTLIIDLAGMEIYDSVLKRPRPVFADDVGRFYGVPYEHAYLYHPKRIVMLNPAAADRLRQPPEALS